MSLLSALFRRRQAPETSDPNPLITPVMPVRPYRIVHAGIPFYADPECRTQVPDAHLLILRSEDPAQKHHPVECMPALKDYRAGDIVQWDINFKKQWPESWYKNPETGNTEKAWMRAVEFAGKVVRLPGAR